MVFFRAIFRPEAPGSAIFVLVGAGAAGAAARIYARIAYGNPGATGTIPIVIEAVLPLLIVLLLYSDGKDAKRR